jgi:sec-independent protein translocase protein TatA
MSTLAAHMPIAVFGFSGSEVLLVLAALLLLFGGTRLPSLARGLGQSIKEFKKAVRDEEPESKPQLPDDAGKKEPANTPHGPN